MPLGWGAQPQAQRTTPHIHPSFWELTRSAQTAILTGTVMLSYMGKSTSVQFNMSVGRISIPISILLYRGTATTASNPGYELADFLSDPLQVEIGSIKYGLYHLSGSVEISSLNLSQIASGPSGFFIDVATRFFPMGTTDTNSVLRNPSHFDSISCI